MARGKRVVYMTAFNTALDSKKDVVYLHGSAELRSDIIGALDSAGYEIHKCRELEELRSILDTCSPAFVIVDASAGENEASERVLEISSQPVYHKLPLIFISTKADSRAQVLKRNCESVLPINVPYSLKNVLISVHQFCQEQANTAAEEKESMIETPGAQFALAKRVSFFEDDSLLENHPQSADLKKVLNTLSERSEWLGLHARRVGYLAESMASSLNIAKGRADNITAVGYSLNLGLLEDLEEFRGIDLFKSTSVENVNKLVRTYLNSAHMARMHLQNETVESTIKVMADLLQLRPAKETNQELIEDAQFAMLADLADRACWGEFGWDASGARRVIRKLSNGFDFIPNKEIKLSLARVMVNAILSSSKNLSIYGEGAQKSTHDQELISHEIAQASELYPREQRLEVKISDLEPGMKLTDPLVSNDGHLIVSAGTKLNSDSIWRLWRLIGLRPFRDSVEVHHPASP